MRERFFGQKVEEEKNEDYDEDLEDDDLDDDDLDPMPSESETLLQRRKSKITKSEDFDCLWMTRKWLIAFELITL